MRPYPTRPEIEMDTECVANYWLCKLYLPDGRMVSFPMWPGKPLDRAGLQHYIDNYTLVSFNGLHYDRVMLKHAMWGADTFALKRLNDVLIPGEGRKGPMEWQLNKTLYPLAPLPTLDLYDLFEVAPGVKISLKKYMARNHEETVQDLPFDPDAMFDMVDRVRTDTYCGNDLSGTRGLKRVCKERIALRHSIGDRYSIDVRSRSDAQIAEDVFKARLGFKPVKRMVPHGHRFQYQMPAFIGFQTPRLQEVLEIVRNAVFIVNDLDQIRNPDDAEEVLGDDGKPIKTGLKMPQALKDLVIKIGGASYKFGIGGLHSQESSVAHRAIKGLWRLIDRDVKSYYPSLILRMGLFPEALGPAFLEIYRAIYDERLDAKARAQILEKHGIKDAEFEMLENIAGGLKIVLNGTFGKLGSKYSIFFAPELLIQITITGQLLLLMLIEAMHLNHIEAISANTDGVVFKVPHGLDERMAAVIDWWEKLSGMETEETEYQALFSRDVNNYLAIKLGAKPGKQFKGKGAYAESGVLNNVDPTMDVCLDAVKAYIADGTPLEQTIRACSDPRRFLLVRNVGGGGVLGGERLTELRMIKGGVMRKQGCGVTNHKGYLGKTVRWYYGRGSTDCIRALGTGNKASDSDGCVPMMRLTPTLPADVDYDRYVAAAKGMLKDIGLTV